MPDTWRTRLRAAVGALAVGGFLILWLAVWPFWRALSHHVPVSAKASSRQG